MRCLPAFASPALWLLIFSAGCGPMPMPQATRVSVADLPAALTSGGDDQLFQLTLSEADEALSISEVAVHVGLPGQTATVVNFTHDDKNNDGRLNVGETLSTREPGVNLFDSTTGKASP